MNSGRYLVAAGLLAGLCLAGCSRPPAVQEAEYLAKGKKLFAKKDYARAMLEFRNAIKVKPSDAEPYYQLSLVYLSLGDVNSAAAYLRKATEVNPKHTEAQVKLSALMARSGRKELVEDAAKRMEGVVGSAPDNADALNTLALAEWRLGHPQDAERYLEQAFTKFPRNLESVVGLARVKLSQKDPKGAEEVLKKAASQQPPVAAAFVALGEFYRDIGKPPEAEQQFQRAVQLDPKNGRALLDLAALELRTGRKEQADQTYRRVAALPDKRFRPVHAIFLFSSGDRQGALAEFEQIFQKDPEDRAARSQLVEAYLSLNRPDDAMKILNAAIGKNAKDADALLQHGAVSLRLGKVADAQNDATKLIQLRAYPPQAHYLMAQVHQARGATLSQKQELGDALKANPSFLPARIDLAKLLIATNAPKDALELLDEKPAPASLGFVVQRNWALIALRRQAEARESVEKALARAKVPDLLLQDALLKLDRQDYAGARVSAVDALRMSPDDVRGLRILASSYSAQKQNAAALQAVREYAAQRPNSAPVQYFWGQLLLSAGNRTDARAAFAAAASANPANTAPKLALAGLDIAEGKTDQARASLSSILSANPSDAAARLMLASLEESAKNYTAALQHYLKLLAGNPDNLAALNNAAYLLAVHTNQQDQALQYAQRAKQLAPDNAAIDDTLGWVLFQKGLYSNALPHLQTAVQQQPTAIRKYHLAMACLKTGDRSRGIELLQSVVKTDPNLPEAKAAQQVLMTNGVQ